MRALIFTSSLGIIAMLAEIFGFKKHLWSIIIAGLVLTLGSTLLFDWNNPKVWYNMMYFDHYAAAFTSIILLLALVWFLVSKDQYEHEFNISDHYSLILFSATGGIALTSFSDLSMLFLGIEILSIPLYILAGSLKKDLSSNEASLKYFMMGAFATGILLFGIALIYGATGSFNLGIIANYVAENKSDIPLLFYAGLLMMMIGLAFKVSAVPFHFWTPDVYQGAPIMITAFMATLVKTAGFAAFYRLFMTCFAPVASSWQITLAIIITLTIIVGNLLAIYQTSVKRMLAYSGIAQAGYLLLPILILNEQSMRAIIFYSASYSFSTLAAFAVLYFVIKTKGNDSFESFNSFGKSQPLLAIIMAVSMLSLAGIPPAVGFFAKFYLFATVLKYNDGQFTWLAVVAVLGSLVSVYYYFRLIIGMYAKEGEISHVEIQPVYKTVLIIMAGIIVILGILPGLLIDKL
jgi:NADH-quinone oxidoreductase subunit N